MAGAPGQDPAEGGKAGPLTTGRAWLRQAVGRLRQAIGPAAPGEEPEPISRRDLPFLLALLVPLTFIRAWRLHEVPPNVTGDEVTYLNDILRVLHGGMSPFSLGGDGSQPALNFYYMAAFVKLLGEENAAVAMRLSSAVMSIGAIAAFYFYLRLRAGRGSSLLATALLGTNFVFLNFSRGSWMNAGTIFFGILSFLLLELALRQRRLWLSAGAGLAGAGALYGYAAGRVFPPTSLAYLGYLALRRRLPWRAAAAHGALFSLVLLLAFLPQLLNIMDNYDRYTLRARSTFIGNVETPYYGQTEMPGILWHQVTYALRGFLFLDPALGGEGVENARYSPTDEAPVDEVTRILFFLAIVTVVLVHRRDIFQPALALAATIVGGQVLTAFPPNYARGLFLIPFVYLLVGLLLDRAWSLPWARRLTRALILVGVGFLALWNTQHYFQWGASQELAAARQPAISNEEVPLWVEIEKHHIRQGLPDLLITSEEWESLTATRDGEE